MEVNQSGVDKYIVRVHKHSIEVNLKDCIGPAIPPEAMDRISKFKLPGYEGEEGTEKG